ncbi:MAG: hypothetical protein H0Z24_10625, partial [Thermosipho sp. (in: Bacteria)]|nr:hypothetical protein [Thermosipho sp. (in: thermotogales)]
MKIRYVFFAAIVTLILLSFLSKMNDEIKSDYNENKLSQHSLSETIEDTWITSETQHFIFYYKKDFEITDTEMELCEEFFQKMSRLFKVTLDKKIEYYKHPERNQQYIQSEGRVIDNIYAKNGIEIHSIYGYHPHEIMHVITYWISERHIPQFFSEGIAVAYGGTESYMSEDRVHLYGKELIEQCRTIPTKELISHFRNYSVIVSYLQSGSFNLYLVQKYGIEKYIDLY